MAHVRRTPDDIARPELLNGMAFDLSAAGSGGDDQALAQRVLVPRGTGTRLEANERSTDL